MISSRSLRCIPIFGTKLSAPGRVAAVPVGGILIDAHHDDAEARVEPANIDCGIEPFIAGKCRGRLMRPSLRDGAQSVAGGDDDRHGQWTRKPRGDSSQHGRRIPPLEQAEGSQRV